MTRALTITLPSETLDALKGTNQALYAVKGVKYGFRGVSFPPIPRLAPAMPVGWARGYGGGALLIWRFREDYLANTTLKWDPEVDAYISNDPIQNQASVSVGVRTPIDLGQTVHVSPTGGLTPMSGGGDGAITVLNEGTDPWTCGLIDRAAGAQTCAFPLYGGAMDVFQPLDKVLLMFAANLMAAGQVIETAYSDGLLVDAADADRAVTFDINLGWSAGGAAWASPVKAGANLSELMITT